MTNSAVLLVNLGSPDAPTVSAVRRYLREFLMDGRVLDAPWPIRFMIVHGFILPFRPRRSAEAYQQVWTAEGSPLVVISRRVQRWLQARMALPVELAMRYQSPSIAEALRRLAGTGATDLHLIPLFPHYAMSSYETAVERVKELLPKLAPRLRLRVQPPYFDHPDYIAALDASAEPDLQEGYDHLLFSFHGLPERHLRKSDPTGQHCLATEQCCQTANPAHATCYRHQCFQTVKAFVQKAGVPEGKYSVAFQSRLGRDPWLKPASDVRLREFPAEGVKRLVVICPAFVSDCLETLEEMGIRGRESFLQSGGKSFRLISCLNEHPLWLAALEKMVHNMTRAASQEGVPS